MKRHSISLSILLVVAAIGCAQPAAQESPELAELGATWADLFNARDMDGLLALYAEDARLLPPNSEAGSGHDFIRGGFQAMIDAGLTADLQNVEAMTSGDLGYRVGTFTLTMADGSLANKGKYVETWLRVDDRWRMSNDIFNSDLPAFGTGVALASVVHEVEDAEHWMAAWRGVQSRASTFKANGARSVRVFQSPQNPNLTGLLVEISDMTAFQAFLASEEGKAAKAEDGVKDETMRVLMEVE